MFLVDDILFAPLKGLAAVCRHVQDAARQELDDQKRAAVVALSELHQRLELGQIDEEEFDIREAGLLERIEGIERTLNADG